MLAASGARAQATVYTPLYTSGTFTKTINVSLPTGTVSGSPGSVSGGAAYSLPIAIPPGTNGVAPSIAVTYNSMGGNGPLGRGWGITGLSAITRVGQAIYYNGSTKPVDLTANDRYSLDGERLMTKSGYYGAASSTYGTEMEDFGTLTASSTLLGSGPQSFTLVTKDGVTMEYGATADSRFTDAANTVVLIWRLNKILYTDGNYIEFKYTNLDRDARIDEINYTGNTAAGLAPYNKLKFSYTIRTDVTTTYEANISMVSKYLLDKITITTEASAAFKTYTFKYATNNNVNSFLKEVIEAGSDGSTLNSTIFKYGDLPSPTLQTGSSSAIAGLQVDVFPGDVNGDGYSDIIACTRDPQGSIVYNTDFKVFKKDPSPLNNTFINTATVSLPANYIAFQPYQGTNHSNRAADFNGDGAEDVIFTKTTGTGSSRQMEEVRVYTSPATGSTYGPPLVLAPYSGWKYVNTTGKYFLIGDFNGDGRSDILTMLGQTTSLFRTAIYYGGGSYWYDTGVSGTNTFTESDWPSMDQIQVLDFNGDGKDDIMLVKDGWCEIYTYDDQQFAKRIYARNFPNDYHLLFTGDFNGDGKSDLLVRNSLTDNNAAWYYHISTGTDFIEYPFTFSHKPDVNAAYFGDKILIADYNGDGKTDIAHGWDVTVNGVTTAKIDMYYSKGDGFYTEQQSYGNYFNSDPASQFLFDSNGDGKPDIMNRTYYGDPIDILFYHKESKEMLLHKVKNGVDNTTEWTYKRMTEAGTFYTRGALTSHPLNNVQAPLNLVYELKSQNGIGGTTTAQYSYEEAKLHKEGKGVLGFKKVTENNLALGMKTVSETNFNTTFYVATPYKTSTYLTSTSALLSETTLTNQVIEQGIGTKRVWVKLTNTTENNVFAHRINSSSNNTFDSYGNVTENVSDTNGNETTTTTTTYGTFGTPVPAKPTSVTVSNVRCCGPAAYAVTTTYGYNALGQVTSKTDFSGLPKSVVTTFGYNSLGNLTSTTVTPAGMTARTTSNVYDTKGRFALSITNALGQTATATFDPKWGRPLTQTGIDGLTTTFTYDAFGRLATTLLPTGFTMTETYSWDINATEGTIHQHRTSHPGKPDMIVWYDLLNRERKNQLEGFQGQWITTKTTYDARGNVATTTNPYKTGETVLTTTNLYDAYNRLYNVSNSVGTTSTSYSYGIDGYLTTTTTNPAAQVSTKVTDPTGKITSATDYGGTLNYYYNSQGNLTRVDMGTTPVVYSEFDAYAHQTKITDVNAGITQYDYNALGQLISQTSPLGQTTTFSYDLLGRTTQQVGPEGTTTTEYYGNGTGASTGKVKKITGFTSGNLQEYVYDAYGRVSIDKQTVEFLGNYTTYTYNIYNDVTAMSYPSGFIVNSTYDANGYLNTLKNGDNTVTLFTNTGMNGYNQYTTYSLGNGKSTTNTYYFGVPTRYFTTGVQDLNLTWNYLTGNLTSRYDAIKGKTESFTYDNLNRLLTSSGTGLSTITMTYANNGNISTKTDAGNYGYNSSKINAVEYISNPTVTIPLTTQNVTYTPYFQPATISEGSNVLTYTYGIDKQRIKGVLTQGGSVTDTRYYFGGGYEKDIIGGTTKHLHYIDAGQGVVAIVVRDGSTDTYNYVYTDHLGSILTVTSNTGAVVAEQNFDAWGRKRNTTNWTYTGVQAVPTWLFRGFTGHEHLPLFNLINMNGRLYDPIAARMLSTDNNIQNPDFTQNYNRYSYVLNNPLRYTDPDGEFVFIPILIGAAIGAVISAATYSATVLATGQNWTWKGFGKAAAFGAVAGAISAGIGSAFAGSAFGQSVAFGVLKNGVSNIVTNLVFNKNEISAGMVAGSIISGAIAGAIPGFSGVNGGAVANILAEIGYDAAIGGFSGAFGGTLGAFIDHRDPGQGFTQGITYGAIAGGTKAALNVLAMGPTYKPEGTYGPYGKYGPVFRTGTPVTRFFGGSGSGITIGRNLITHQLRYQDEFEATPHLTSCEQYNQFLRAHEYYHYIQQVNMGYTNFYGTNLWEYHVNGFQGTYGTPGSLENMADAYAIGIFFSLFGH